MRCDGPATAGQALSWCLGLLGLIGACSAAQADDSPPVPQESTSTPTRHSKATPSPASAPAASSQPSSRPTHLPTTRHAPAPVKPSQSKSSLLYPVPKPPFTEGVFPCTQCHDKSDTPNTKRRTLSDEHTKIQLHHGRDRWCFDCHNPSDRDRLRLAGGTLVPFTESYRLCGQCHGTKLRDWRVGVHGKRTGFWNGKKRYLLCAHCHDPHNPRFKALAPMPAPIPPGELR